MELTKRKEKAKQLNEQLPTSNTQMLFEFCGGFDLETEEQKELWEYIQSLSNM